MNLLTRIFPLRMYVCVLIILGSGIITGITALGRHCA